MQIILDVLVKAVAVFIAQYFLPGVSVDAFLTAVIVAIVLGIVNIIVKPVIHLITLPLTIITFGLFSFVINALMILLVDYFVDGFQVNGFFTALIFSLVLSIVSSILNMLVKSDE